MTTISCCMIVRDAQATLERALASIRGHVDELIVVDTGSVDASKQIATRYADQVLDFAWCEDFSAARQFAHDACTSEWVFYIDADDEVVGGQALRERVETAPDHMDAYMIRYTLEPEAHGKAVTEFWRERLIRKHRMAWAGRVHEVMVPLSGHCQYERFAATVVLHHGHGDHIASLARNVRLLELALAEAPDDLRTQFYLGRDYVQLGRLDEGIALLERYVANAVWDDEQFIALTMIGYALRLQHKYADAYRSDARLITVHATWPQAWFMLAQDAYYLHRWADSVHLCEIGQGCPAPATNLFVSPAELESGWMIYQAVALWHCARVEEAAELTIRALSLLPDNQQHQQNAVYFESQLRQRCEEREAVLAS